jgi:hypothetical protein
MKTMWSFDPQGKFWKCSCGACRDVATVTRIALVLVLWDIDRLLSLVRRE